MTSAILDTNVFVQATFSASGSASYRTIVAQEQGKFRLIFSEATIDELLDVLQLPNIRASHRWSDDQILRFVSSFVADATIYTAVPSVPASLVRDATDAKFLGLAELSRADFLVTNDRRHFLPLRHHGHTKIVTPAQFLRDLS